MLAEGKKVRGNTGIRTPSYFAQDDKETLATYPLPSCTRACQPGFPLFLAEAVAISSGAEARTPTA